MKTSYFLGANTACGFVSLYGDFCRGERDYLHIIKGGPGTGKSGLMRAIGREAERRGLDVEYVQCSGDPKSLDGVYLPSLSLGWCDGTAPHAAEPGIFGADSDYLNVGQFCRTPLSPVDCDRARALVAAYKAKYKRAYALLAAAESAERAFLPQEAGAKEAGRAGALLCELIARLPAGETPRLRRRFCGAVSCEGLVEDRSSFTLCKLAYLCEDGCGLAAGALGEACETALSLGHDVVLCLSPADGKTPDALLLPDVSAGFVRAMPQASYEHVKRIPLDRLWGDMASVKERRRAVRAAKREGARYLRAACETLREAKALHDELEAVYRPYMDFPSLDALAAKEIARVFS